ncbi:ATP synthase regulation protein NCA2-domain-containing protein [Ephemerocybe angulata]|uniref:ATP synthase regulation protein NCA2-domain-containing protein n=1 Tax=Ephemerocybe angulata TaxID=980116 RepID=A0A8H6MDR3_9AGAR|nr:ATP synthase regulation protein NCA2-domain-containing protein [Tulosesus angulatus]
MASDFVLSFTTPLLQGKDHFTSTTVPTDSPLSALLASLDKPHLTTKEIANAAEALQKHDEGLSALAQVDQQNELLKQAIVIKLTVALYADALEMQIQQSLEMENEAQWWADVERSKKNVAWYLLQTLPRRLADLFTTIVQHIHAQNPQIGSLRSLSVSSLVETTRASLGTIRPGVFLSTVFPQPLSVLSSAQVWRRNLLLPLELAQQECKYNRLKLEKLRDERATTLGELALLRGRKQKADELLQQLLLVLSPDSNFTSSTQSPVDLVQHLSTTILPSLSTSHHPSLQAQNLLRPSRLTQLWPKLLLIPPLTIYAIHLAYTTTPVIAAFLQDAKETTEAFIQGWLVEPLKDVLRTIRAGSGGIEGDGGVIVRPEGVRADMDSLERMAVSLAVDVLGYDPTDTARINLLREQVRVGDLTDIMRVYEEDMRSPVTSAIRGRLVRGILLQVQKAKVDIDQTLTGIDRLLKSQELTFAFVGVAPALGITYFVLGALRRALFLDDMDRAQRRYGGAARRGEAWADMRRIERTLIRQPKNGEAAEGSESALSPLSTGLVLLSLTRLRAYAKTYLPESSKAGSGESGKKAVKHGYPQLGGMRAAFLEDLSDLEDPSLGRHAKMRVVERMWRSWGKELGW